MRLLIIALLSFCIQTFVICTEKDGSVTFAQKTVPLSSAKSISGILINKKASTAIERDNLSIGIESYSLKLAKRLSKGHLFHTVSGLINPPTINLVNKLFSHISFIPHFMLGCLYPKHCFW